MRWIPVNKPPKRSEKVLVYGHYKDGTEYFSIDIWEGEDWKYLKQPFWNMGITYTHWQWLVAPK